MNDIEHPESFIQIDATCRDSASGRLLDRYTEGDLTPAEWEQLLVHMEMCARCRVDFINWEMLLLGIGQNQVPAKGKFRVSGA